MVFSFKLNTMGCCLSWYQIFFPYVGFTYLKVYSSCCSIVATILFVHEAFNLLDKPQGVTVSWLDLKACILVLVG
jgi:hypothetical protein